MKDVHDSANPFEGGGAVGGDLALVDWDSTPLGRPGDWPQSLVSAVRVVLSSRFSMWMAWGPELTFFCNDAYRRDTLGEKYPWALGKPASSVWAEIWPDIGPRIETVMTTGVATWDEALMLFLERNGYVEESYHTFSYSPLSDEQGDIVGMLCVVSEVTEGVLGTNRMQTLSGVGEAVAKVQTEADVIWAACEELSLNAQALPFTLLYCYDESGVAQLVGSSGVPLGHPVEAFPWTLGLNDLDGVPDLPTGAWQVPPRQAIVVPFRQQPDAPAFGYLVAAINPHRVLDEGYDGFIAVVAAQLAAAIAGARAYDEERERAVRLAELDRAKTAFFTNVSHELRTPLTLLLGPAEDALADQLDPLPPRQRERVEVMSRNAQRLLRLVNTLLDFSRLESGSAAGSFEPVDLAEYTTELAGAFQVAVSRVGLHLVIDCPPLAEPVWIDREMWAKVVLNLLSNALKFTFEGSITVRLQPSGEGVALSVSDTGTGIPSAAQSRLFERFNRVDGAASRTHEGSGIGLALVAELAELHGGSVGVESTVGQGSTFTVRLPWGSAHLPAEQVVQGAPERVVQVEKQAEGFVHEAMRWLDSAPTHTAPQEGDRPRILVVDDNADMRAYVAGLLSLAYDVTTASDGLDGLAQARALLPDLVLTDVMMPGIDGFELLERLRADATTTDVPVIMLSARAGEEATVEGLDAGADDYLIKPFSARELLARVRSNLELDRVRRVRAQLERSREMLDQSQRLAQVGSWEFDLVQGTIRGTDEFFRQVGYTREALENMGFDAALAAIVPPAEAERVGNLLQAGMQGDPVDYELTMLGPSGEPRTYRTLAELVFDELGNPSALRGSSQDITERIETERVLAEAAAEKEAAAREHSIADELQASLLPALGHVPDHLDVATFYRAGVEGTQVGGDWYDVIELGAGRTALVLGDVMGRGVQAAAVMGQLRSATRAYARLDLPPADVLENLDAAVRELGSDQIVTCVYAVYDPSDRTLTYANAGHLPPLLCEPGQRTRRLTGSSSPPLGIGLPGIEEETIALKTESLVVLYTDGLVEHRDSDIDTGVDDLARELDLREGPLAGLPERLVQHLIPDGQSDDIAVLLARVDQSALSEDVLIRPVSPHVADLHGLRATVRESLDAWGISPELRDDVVLLVSELATNAIIHGRPPAELRLRSSPAHLVLEVQDHATYLPRRIRPTVDDEHGRGLQLTALLSTRWGTRPTRDGKVVWCVFPSGR